MMMLRLGAVACLVLVALLGAAAPAHGDAQAVRQLTREDLSHKRVSELRRFLEERGADCLGCVEKTHFVDRALEVQSWPLKPSTPKPKPSKQGDPDIDEMLKAFQQDQERKKKMHDMLRKQGINLGDQDDAQAKILESLQKMRKRPAKQDDSDSADRDRGSEDHEQHKHEEL
ncbi:hypothetical protein PTSG_09314 [Salpingoeca rosetta]|uniref:ARMET C-terminal domain-containing protein n=1 Tax=Salpingoeca rosetta (strain ATCC 50818 / BSB-021) TaxID=946362 RepID=F2UM99_SALR5|nr:uncharacterized protein PTSG_09314 [Salpingoeca rosetta]EGD78248.1 hypothetical protein PTSG_09314 [Salpingoeca rosetta]|eukprot:XP_004989571.1 hypothetical protein PTSG_09314 [Salpingoeca rosetta]